MRMSLRARKFSDFGHFSSWFDLRTQNPQNTFVVGSNWKVISDTKSQLFFPSFYVIDILNISRSVGGKVTMHRFECSSTMECQMMKLKIP